MGHRRQGHELRARWVPTTIPPSTADLKATCRDDLRADSRVLLLLLLPAATCRNVADARSHVQVPGSIDGAVVAGAAQELHAPDLPDSALVNVSHRDQVLAAASQLCCITDR